jgi:threonine synthase
LQTGNYTPKKSVATISNAMDVGNPSNFVRILELFHKEFQSLKNVMCSYSFSDEETKDILKEVYLNDGYLLDPHGAVGYVALKKYLQEHFNAKGMFLETAHPVKFYDVVEPVISQKVPMPTVVNDLLHLKKESIKMKGEYSGLKDYLVR